jgi:hypothetical protein
MSSLEESAETSITSAAVALDQLSRKHYGETLGDLLQEVDTPLGRLRYARLLGVMVKAPFAEEVVRRPARATGAVVALRWKTDQEIRSIAPGTWQFEFMRELLSEQKDGKATDADAFSQLTYYKYESTLGKFLLEAFRDRICGDARTTKAVREAIIQAKKTGVRLTDPTAAGLSVATATFVATAVAHLLPTALAFTGGPLVGTIALLLMQVGIDGFCRWSHAAVEEAGSQGYTDAEKKLTAAKSQAKTAGKKPATKAAKKEPKKKVAKKKAAKKKKA